MSEEHKDGGPAFPTLRVVGDEALSQGGLTIRDYFAAHCPITFSEFMTGWKRASEASTDDALRRFAKLRSQYADAMIAARDKSESEAA